MIFNHIPGNEHIKGYLEHMLETERVGNSLLFAGPKGVRKEAFAMALARHLVQANQRIDHPDIRVYRPEGKIAMHSIDSMRRFCEEVYLAPFESKWKVFIILDAERMLPTSANALLKTFEEPSKDSLIILVSSDPVNLLPTVLSRCRKVYFQPIVDSEKTQIVNSNVQFLLNVLANGKMRSYQELRQVAGELAEQIEKTKKELEESSREQLIGDRAKDFNAAQREMIDKEIDGAVAVQFQSTTGQLFQAVLSWYRDLHLLQVRGNPDLLINKELRPQLELALKQPSLLSIEQVEKAINETKLAIARFCSLSSCLESLFLKLGIV